MERNRRDGSDIRDRNVPRGTPPSGGSGGGGIGAFLQQKTGPLPNWAWGIALIGGVGIAYVMVKSGFNPGGTGGGTTTTSPGSQTGSQTGSGGTGGGTGGGTTTPSGTDQSSAISNILAWIRANTNSINVLEGEVNAQAAKSSGGTAVTSNPGNQSPPATKSQPVGIIGATSTESLQRKTTQPVWPGTTTQTRLS